MSRRQKHGIVVSGRNITLYGDNARSLLAERTAASCYTQADAYRRMRDLVPGTYRDAVARALKKRGFKVQKAFDPDKAKK